MWKLITAVAISAILTAPAYAQGRGKGGSQPPSAEQQAQAQEQKKRAAEIEKAHKAALERIPDQKVADPWANMR
jgi:hypothetical protein